MGCGASKDLSSGIVASTKPAECGGRKKRIKSKEAVEDAGASTQSPGAASAAEVKSLSAAAERSPSPASSPASSPRLQEVVIKIPEPPGASTPPIRVDEGLKSNEISPRGSEELVRHAVESSDPGTPPVVESKPSDQPSPRQLIQDLATVFDAREPEPPAALLSSASRPSSQASLPQVLAGSNKASSRDSSSPRQQLVQEFTNAIASELSTSAPAPAPVAAALKRQLSRTPSPSPADHAADQSFGASAANSRASSPQQFQAAFHHGGGSASSSSRASSRATSPAVIQASAADSRASYRAVTPDDYADSKPLDPSTRRHACRSTSSDPLPESSHGRSSQPSTARVSESSRGASPAPAPADARGSQPSTARLSESSRGGSPAPALDARSSQSSTARLSESSRGTSPAPALDARSSQPSTARLSESSRGSSPAAALRSSQPSTTRLSESSRGGSPALAPAARMSESSRAASPAVNLDARGSQPSTARLSESSRAPAADYSRGSQPSTARRSESSRGASPIPALDRSQGSQPSTARHSEVSRGSSPHLSECRSQVSRASGASSHHLPQVPRGHTSRTPSPALNLQKPSPSQEDLRCQFRFSYQQEQERVLVHLSSSSQTHDEELELEPGNPANEAPGRLSGSKPRTSLASANDEKRGPSLRAASISPAVRSRMSSRSPALSRRESWVPEDDHSADATLRAIVRRVTEEAVAYHNQITQMSEARELRRSETAVLEFPAEADKVEADESSFALEESKDELIFSLADELTSSEHLASILSSVEAKKKDAAAAASAKLAARSLSPRPGLLEYYLGLRSGEYSMSPPSSSGSSQNDALAGIKDALEEIDITKDLLEEVDARVTSPALDVESIYNQIRKLTFSEHDKVEHSSNEHLQQVEVTKTQVVIEKEEVHSPISSTGGSVDEVCLRSSWRY